MKNKYGFLLRGLVRCASCNCAMTPSSSRKGPRIYRYYVCASAQRKGYKTCPCPSIPAKKLETAVIDQVRRIGQDEDLQGMVLAEARRRLDEQVESADTELRRWASKRDKVRDEISGLITALSKGTVQGHSISDRLVELEAKSGERSQRMQQAEADLAALKASSHRPPRPSRGPLPSSTSMGRTLPDGASRIIDLLVKQVDYDGSTGT